MAQEETGSDNNSTDQVEKESDENTWYVKVDSSSPDAILHDDTDFFEQQPIGRLLSNQPVTRLEEEDGEYVKIRAVVDGKEVEGWIKKIVLTKKPVENKPRVTESGATESQAFASNASMGRVNFDEEDPWQQMDPASAEAKLKASPFPYHLIIPGGIAVAGGGLALALALANKDSSPDPDPPIDDPIVDDPEFTLLKDSYSVICGQSLLIYPLQNDVGTGLFITALTDGPEGIQLINDTTISIPSNLSESITFSIEIEDAIGQTGTSTVSISVEEIEIAANDDQYNLEAGETISGNVVDNDLCLSCEVVNTQGTIGTLEMEPSGDFEYTAPTDFSGEAIFTITVEDPCGAQDTSNLIFNITLTGCDLALVNDTLEVNAGEIVEGNVFDNDLCEDCTVMDVTDAEGLLDLDANGAFSYTATNNFDGTVVFTITSVDACGQEGIQNLVFIVLNPPCSFDWPGEVVTDPANCGLQTGAAFATEELFGPYNFSWSNGVEGTENTDLPADSYQLFVTDTITGCIDTLEAIVDELPPDYALDFETLTGACGATDNVQLFSNASPDQPISIALTGATDGMIENVTDPAIWLGDFVALNPGPLTITVWAEEAGPECTQSIALVLEQAPTPELVVLDTGPELIVLEINNAIFPVDIFVNGELFMTSEEPIVFLEGLPPGIYEIFGVDATGCASPVVVVELEGGGIQKPIEIMRWSPQTRGLNNWIQSPDQLIMQTVEGQDGYFPVGGQTAIPVFIELTNGQWVASGATTSNNYMSADGGTNQIRQTNYFELAAGRQFKIFESTVSVKLGRALWNPESDRSNNVRGWFIDGTYNLRLNSAPGHIQLGFRAGIIDTSTKILLIPSVQYTLPK